MTPVQIMLATKHGHGAGTWRRLWPAFGVTLLTTGLHISPVTLAKCQSLVTHHLWASENSAFMGSWPFTRLLLRPDAANSKAPHTLIKRNISCIAAASQTFPAHHQITNETLVTTRHEGSTCLAQSDLKHLRRPPPTRGPLLYSSSTSSLQVSSSQVESSQSRLCGPPWTVPSPTMAALRMASLWERRLSGEQAPSPKSPASSIDSVDEPARLDSVDDPVRLDVDPFDEKGAKRRWQPARRRIRRGVSGKKPPVPPPTASGQLVRIAEEVPLTDNALLDGTSPVSSFVGSAPSSPGVADCGPDVNVPVGGRPRPASAGILEEIEALRWKIKMWDSRMEELEEKNRALTRQITRLSARFSRPRP